MTTFDSKQSIDNPIYKQGLRDLSTNEASFFEWLKKSNCKGYSPARILGSLSEATRRLQKRNFTDKSIWEINLPDEFFFIQNKAVKDKTFCGITGHKNMPLFQLSSQLYFLFLKENAQTQKVPNQSETVDTDKGAVSPPKASIDPEDVVAWLVTQTNAYGSLYLESVVRSYMRTLRNAPPKLELDNATNINVFEYHSVAELDELISIFKSAKNYAELNKKMGHGQLSAGLAVYRRYLENIASNEDIIVIKPPVAISKQQEQEIQIEPTMSKSQYVDFSRLELCAQTKPVSCSILGQAIVSEKQNWSSLLVAITEFFIGSGSPNLERLNDTSLYGSKVFFMPRKAEFGTCSELSNGKWLYTNYNPQIVVTIIRNLCSFCEVNLENVLIAFVPKHYPAIRKKQGLHSVHSQSKVIVSEVSIINDDEIRFTIDLVLSEKFANGFAYTSPIQIGRLRKFVGELVGKDIDDTDEAIITYAKQSGIVFDSKAYVVSADAKEQIRQIADEYFSCGAEAIFYEAFFEKHEHFLMDASVVSVDMLRRVFQKLYPKFYSNEIYFGKIFENITVIITNEILRVWNCDGMLTYSQIAERLPYIPYNRIKFVLGQNGDFIINRRGRGDNDGECIHISKIYVTEAEKARFRDLIEAQCEAHRYISLADLDLNEIAEKNYELSISAIQAAVFQMCCTGTRYVRHGKIVTRRGEDIDALYIMKEFCRIQDKIMLEDLLAFEVELTGEQHRWIPMQAGYDTMVRINEQVFVADGHLDIDTNAIDNAIEHFMNGGEYIPLQSVTTFAMFPYCKQSWNLYLLESYCRRFSPNFRFETRAVNSKNTGAIIRKNSRLTYDDIMADYVARSNVALTKQAVLDYLFDNGLISVRKHKDIEKLIRTIRTIKERRD